MLSETLLQFHYTRVVAAMSQQKERDEANRARGKVASAKNVFGLLVYLLTCPWNAPRKEAARIVSKHNSEKDELSELLVRAFFQAVKPASEDDLAAKKVAIEKEEDVPTTKSDDGQARSSIYFHALLNCLKADGQDKETSQSRREAIHRVLPFVLVLAHHPFILPSVQYQCWARCLAIAGISLKVPTVAHMAVSMKSSSFVSSFAATGLLARGHEGYDQRSASFPVRGPLRAGHQRSAAERQQVR